MEQVTTRPTEHKPLYPRIGKTTRKATLREEFFHIIDPVFAFAERLTCDDPDVEGYAQGFYVIAGQARQRLAQLAGAIEEDIGAITLEYTPPFLEWQGCVASVSVNLQQAQSTRPIALRHENDGVLLADELALITCPLKSLASTTWEDEMRVHISSVGEVFVAYMAHVAKRFDALCEALEHGLKQHVFVLFENEDYHPLLGSSTPPRVFLRKEGWCK